MTTAWGISWGVSWGHSWDILSLKKDTHDGFTKEHRDRLQRQANFRKWEADLPQIDAVTDAKVAREVLLPETPDKINVPLPVPYEMSVLPLANPKKVEIEKQNMEAIKWLMTKFF